METVGRTGSAAYSIAILTVANSNRMTPFQHARISEPGWKPFLAFACRAAEQSAAGRPTFETGYYVKTLKEARHWRPHNLNPGVDLELISRRASQEFGNPALVRAGKDGAFLLIFTLARPCLN